MVTDPRCLPHGATEGTPRRQVTKVYSPVPGTSWPPCKRLTMSNFLKYLKQPSRERAPGFSEAGPWPVAVLHRSPARFPCRSEWLGLREDKPSARNRMTQGPRDPVGIRRCPSAAGCPGRPSAEPAGPRWHRCSRLGSGGRSPQLGQRVFSTDAWGLASQSATASPLSPGPRQTGTDMGCEPEAGACEAQPASPNGHESTDQGFQVSGLN